MPKNKYCQFTSSHCYQRRPDLLPSSLLNDKVQFSWNPKSMKFDFCSAMICWYVKPGKSGYGSIQKSRSNPQSWCSKMQFQDTQDHISRGSFWGRLFFLVFSCIVRLFVRSGHLGWFTQIQKYRFGFGISFWRLGVGRCIWSMSSYKVKNTNECVFICLFVCVWLKVIWVCQCPSRCKSGRDNDG